MKLQPARIKSNDFKSEHKEMATALGDVINPFIDRLVLGFNKNFTVEDNLPFEYKTIDITVDGNGAPTKSNIITVSIDNLKGFICINVEDISGSGTISTPTNTPFVSFSLSNKTVTIRKITGLPASKQFRLTLLGLS